MVATNSTSSTTKIVLSLSFEKVAEASELLKLIIGPTERSIPPVVTTVVCAIPAKTSVILWFEVEVKTDGVKNFPFSDAVILSRTNNMIKAIPTRKFRRIKRRIFGVFWLVLIVEVEIILTLAVRV